MKKVTITIIILIVIGIAYYLISPYWRNTTLNEDLPGLQSALESMTPQQQQEFRDEMEKMADVVVETKQPMPTAQVQTQILAREELVANAHDVEGDALLVKSGTSTVLRFENLETINGPDLRIYLSAGKDVSDAIDLGPIRATRGNVNYELPSGTDLSKYHYALIWCRRFHVLFSYAEF